VFAGWSLCDALLAYVFSVPAVLALVVIAGKDQMSPLAARGRSGVLLLLHLLLLLHVAVLDQIKNPAGLSSSSPGFLIVQAPLLLLLSKLMLMCITHVCVLLL